MKLKSFIVPGSTPSRRRFWDKVTQAVVACQKVAGTNVSVDEYQGIGTVINVGDSSTRRPGGPGACCYDDGTCDDLTEADCDAAEGNWQGSGTTCADDPNPCRGACCEGEDGTTCVDDSTPDSCAADGGTFQAFGSTCEEVDCTEGACCNDGDCSILNESDCLDSGGVFQGGGSLCDPNPCEMSPCNGCGYDAFDESGRKFLTKTTHFSGTSTDTRQDDPCSGFVFRDIAFDITFTTTIDPEDCSESCVSASGTGSDLQRSVHLPECTPTTLVDCNSTYDCDGWSPSECGNTVCNDLDQTVTNTATTRHTVTVKGPTCPVQDEVNWDELVTLSDECDPMA